MQLSSIRSFLTLIRVTLSLAVTFSAFAAYIIYTGKICVACIAPMTAVFFLAAGASILNQIQERKVDSLMERTKNRPIPSGKIKPAAALAVSIFFFVAGIFLFAQNKLWIPLMLGAGNVAWYNGVYTTLKMKTPFALIPGALTGAVPIFMGWSAAGGYILDPEPVFLGLFMFFWQIPHFWLLMLTHATEYKTAGIPAITDHFSSFQVKRMILLWLAAASVTSLMMVTRGFSHHLLLAGLILFLNMMLLIITIYRFFIASFHSVKLLYILVNCFLFIILLLLICESLVS